MASHSFRSANTPSAPRVVVIGAGVIGLSIAWTLAGRGARVRVHERGAAGRGASHAAAGMLAACAELEPGEEGLLALNRASQAAWPDFARRLEAESGIEVGLREEGTLVVALTADDAARLRFQLQLHERHGLPVEWLTPGRAREREPYLAARLAGALWSPEDHQVDNRALARALHVAATKAGAEVFEHSPVEGFRLDEDGAVTGVRAGGADVDADIVVLAAGPWSRAIPGLPQAARPPVRPIKGQMLSLRMPAGEPLVRHVLWGPNIYLVPRGDGRLIVGGTVEERGFDETMTAGGMLTLLEAAWRLVPAIEELPLDETWVGFRPGSRDDAPILGPSGVEGLIVATGHHRNGILLTPITAEAVSAMVLGEPAGPVLAPFTPSRFAQARGSSPEHAKETM